MEIRSRVLIRDLEDKGEKIIIPAVAVAELITPLEPHSARTVHSGSHGPIFLPTIRPRAAAMAAQLWQWHRRLPEQDQTQRSVLKADVLIIAVAKVAGDIGILQP